jgi:MoaA/NifB/PqqE/SkfB family radical SAM enzyme
MEADVGLDAFKKTKGSYISRNKILKRKPSISSIIKVIAGITTKRRAYSGPLKVQISPTNIYNNQCLMCRTHSPLSDDKLYTKTNQHLMQMDLFTRLIDELHALGKKEIQLCGRGEPFLNTNLTDMVKYIKFSGMSCYVTTNGSLLNKNNVEKLVAYQLDVLNISLNSY